METVIYLIRHANKMRDNAFASYSVDEDFVAKNSRYPLSFIGEKNAKSLSEKEEFSDVSIIYSSHFARTIGTAKYLAARLDLKINVDSRLMERIHGSERPENANSFYYNQTHDFNFKNLNGESMNETNERVGKAFDEILDMNIGSCIAIFTHEVAIFSFLLRYCDFGYSLDDKIVLTYGEDFSLPWGMSEPDVIKLTFEDKDIKNIQHLDFGY